MRGWKPWTLQPPAGTPVDWDNPLAQDLRFLYNGATGGRRCGFDVARNFDPGTAISPQSVVTSDGVSAAFPGTGGWYVNDDEQLRPEYVSCLIFGRRTGPVVQYATYLDHFYTNPNASPYNAWGLLGNTNGTNNDDVYFQVSAYFKDAELPTGTLLETSAIVGVYAPTTLALYLNGVAQSGISTGSFPPISYATPYGQMGFFPSWNGYIYCSAVWGHGLNSEEVYKVSTNPWQIFHKRRRVYSGGGGVAAIVEPADAVAGNGSQSVAGTGAIAEAADVVSGTGISMPSIVGITYYQALEVLQDAGIYVPLPAYAFAPSSVGVQWRKSTLRPGFVAAQSIAAGTPVSSGENITLTVSAFPFGAVIDSPPDWYQRG